MLDCQLVTGTFGVFLNDDAVSADRYGCAREDAHGFAFVELAIKSLTRCRFADHRKLNRIFDVLRRDERIAVHGRTIEWWLA
ncbi:hypothetical protein D9M69_551290 [compost metagenome]